MDPLSSVKEFRKQGSGGRAIKLAPPPPPDQYHAWARTFDRGVGRIFATADGGATWRSLPTTESGSEQVAGRPGRTRHTRSL